MLTLLRNLSWPSYRATPGRAALMVGGVAIGVSLIAALDIINASVLSNFRTMLERSAGKAALQIELGTGEIGFADSAVDLAAADPDVQQALGMVRGTLHAPDGSGEVLQLFGVDLVSDPADSYDVRVIGGGNPLELLNDQRSILVTDEYAARQGISVDSPVRFATPTGVVELRVRGLLEAKGLATVFGGNLAVMDLPAAQRLLDKTGRVDQVDLVLKPNATAGVVQQRLASVLPASLSVNRPATRGERFERVINAFQAMLDGLSLLCLLAGVFIVYNTMATAITERAREIGVLLTLGIQRWKILALVLSEGALVGAIASLIGVLLGIAMARLLTTLVAQSMGVLYEVRFPVDELTLTLGQVAWFVALGTGGAIAAAIIPARKAAALDPIELMRPDYRERLAVTSSNRLLISVGLLLLVAAAAALHMEESRRSIAWGNVAASILWLAGLVLVIPAMSWLGALLERLLPRLFGLNGQIAAAGLRRSPGRTGVTAGVIGLSLTLAVGVSSIALSFRESERNWFILTGDLVVSSVGTDGGWLESPLSADVGDVLRAVPGVARVETYRAMQGQQLNDARIVMVAVSPDFVDTPQFRNMIVDGSPDDAVRALRDDREVLASDNLADRFGLRAGDEITVPTPAGPTRMRINAIIANDFSSDQGSIVMHRDRFARLWGDTQVSHFNVFLTPGADLERARAAIVQALHDRYLVKVLTVPQTLAYHQHMVDRAFAFTYAIQLLVIAVTLAGIVDLLTTQVIERRREIGLLRLLGADEPTVARGIWLEALIIGLCGAVFGAIISIGTSLLWVKVNFRILIGYIVEHHFAAFTALWCVILAGGMAMVAGRLAAARALREPVLDTLRYE
jgi:putative ABC transport system permease protein